MSKKGGGRRNVAPPLFPTISCSHCIAYQSYDIIQLPVQWVSIAFILWTPLFFTVVARCDRNKRRMLVYFKVSEIETAQLTIEIACLKSRFIDFIDFFFKLGSLAFNYICTYAGGFYIHQLLRTLDLVQKLHSPDLSQGESIAQGTIDIGIIIFFLSMYVCSRRASFTWLSF